MKQSNFQDKLFYTLFFVCFGISHTRIYRILQPNFLVPILEQFVLFDKIRNREGKKSRFSKLKPANNEIFIWKKIQ